MSNQVYLRFDVPKGDPSPPAGRRVQTIENTAVKIFSTIIPMANPDFEHLMDKVEYWKIEFDKDENVTRRVFGFDRDGISIVAMPLGGNGGFWSDEVLILSYYKRFDSKPISAKEFENDWTEFEIKNTVS